MGLLTKEVEMTWNKKTKQYYIDKGYEFTKYGDVFICKVEDLPYCNESIVSVSCDYCSKEFTKTNYHYNRQRDKGVVKKDCCWDCSIEKNNEVAKVKYGADTMFEVDEVKKKAKEKCRESTRHSDNEVINMFESHGFTVVDISKYKTSRTKLKCKCKIHNDKIQKISYTDLKRYNMECKYCRVDNREYKSNISEYLRHNITPWKVDSMKQCEFKDVLDGSSFNAIHHLFSFNKIVDLTFEEVKLPYYRDINNYTARELELIIDICLKIHYQYPLGVCLSQEHHDLYHSLYGNDNTPEQFEEFKQRYMAGEFDGS